MSGRGAHTKNIPSHPIVVYHPYTWEHYSQYNNNRIPAGAFPVKYGTKDLPVREPNRGSGSTSRGWHWRKGRSVSYCYCILTPASGNNTFLGETNILVDILYRKKCISKLSTWMEIENAFLLFMDIQ